MTTPNSNIGMSVPELVVSAQEGSGAPTWPRIRNLPARGSGTVRALAVGQ